MLCKSIINNKNNQQNMFVTLIDTRLVTSWRLLVRPIIKSSNFRWQLPGRKSGRKLVRAITAESIYRCMLLFLDHILYRRAHFVRDALRELCSLFLFLRMLRICVLCVISVPPMVNTAVSPSKLKGKATLVSLAEVKYIRFMHFES